MYPEVITPRSFPEKLQEVDYDPFGFMPKELPPHPRVFVTPKQIETTKRLVAEGTWVANALELLQENAQKDPYAGMADGNPDLAQLKEVAMHAERNVLAWTLTGETEMRERSLEAMRWHAERYDIEKGTNYGWSGTGMHLARAYDLLAAEPLTDEDNESFRRLLNAYLTASDRSDHFRCGNMATWTMAHRLTMSSALSDMQGVHDALYGCEREGRWRYGFLHQLRHDVLGDGMHWERTHGYHHYAMMGFVELLDLFNNIGVDLWHAELPPQWQADHQDEHRAYGPRGDKCVKAFFDSCFYQAFPNGDFSLVGDSGLGNQRGIWIWGIMYDKAYEAYGDEKYAWLLNKMERENPERKHPGLPMDLQTWAVDLDFARYARASYPEGRFDQTEDCQFSVAATHKNGCTLFPIHGSTVLRSNAADVDAPAAAIFWGPHTAGHQAPAALHLDLYGKGGRITDGPRTIGYADPNYLTWVRTTIAHNTVTVDESPMFPYDLPTESIWECDKWRDRISDSELLAFRPGNEVKTVRVSNENVYPGVLLDRTVIATPAYILDVYRVIGEAEHRYDWAMHCLGSAQVPANAQPIDLGDKVGYRHMTDAKQFRPDDGIVNLSWQRTCGVTHASILPPAGAKLILASDYVPDDEAAKKLGELALPEPRSSVVVRTKAQSCVFVSLWQFDAEPGAKLQPFDAAPDADLSLTVLLPNGEEVRHTVPAVVQ